ncbi:MAG: DUF2911 domain-containing protein [Flavobacteriaceae bacterium]|nr:DUF2911 domain-containing protein [Flavobacteriaceae bacterium]
MKKSTIFTTIAFAFMMLLSTNVNAQKFSGLDKSPLDMSSSKDKTVRVIYSRPQLKGRDLAKLAPNGKVWRTGANEGTEITFAKDMTLGGKSVKAGTYTMTSIPGEKEWTIILNSTLGTWGGNAGKKAESGEVARFMGKASTDSEALEAFSIAFDNKGHMHFGWGTMRVAIPMN